MLDIDVHALDGEAKEAPLPGIEFSPRELMQTLDTEWGRDLYGTNFWVKLAERRLAMLEDVETERFQGAVFSDVRFPQEADWIRQHGGTVIHLHRPGNAQVRAHLSEAGIALHKRDQLITNGGDLDELNARLTIAVEQMIDAGGATACFA